MRMCPERHDNEAADKIVNDRALRHRKVCNSRHTLRNLRRTLAPDEREDKLDAALLDGLPVAAVSQDRLDHLRINELLKCSFDSAPFEERANHGVFHTRKSIASGGTSRIPNRIIIMSDASRNSASASSIVLPTKCFSARLPSKSVGTALISLAAGKRIVRSGLTGVVSRAGLYTVAVLPVAVAPRLIPTM